MKYKLLKPDAYPPIAPKDGNAGYDLPCYGNYVLEPKEVTEISTQIALEIPVGYVGLICGRSGLAFTNSVECWHNGVIDSNYRGELKLLLKNHDPHAPWSFYHGDKVAQILIIPIYIQPLEQAEELSATKRGDKGFGSSGIKQDKTLYLVFDGGNGGYKVNKGYGSFIVRENNRHGKIIYEFTLSFDKPMTNNEAEYATLQAAIHHISANNNVKQVNLVIEGDSELVRNQVGTYNSDTDTWKAWACNLPSLEKYRDNIRVLLTEYTSFTYNHVPREYIVSVLGH